MSDDRKKPREVSTMTAGVTEQPSQHRRRLVKGALSAPVFLTLQNGSVFANTSNDATIMEDVKVGDNLSGLKCAFPLDDSYPREEGEKSDFGPSSMCSDDGVFEIAGDLGPGRCNAREGGMQGGYIVAASSGGSICGTIPR